MADEHFVLAVDTLVTGRYRVVRTIGAGGMATVYQAVDTTKEHPVAIKLLNPSLSGSIATDRFLREIAITSRLQHPLIVPILDSGTHDGSPFFVMPMVDGETLRDRMRREKQLKVSDALRLTRDVLSALRAAHEQNIVHRDIKPANILLKGGHAIVADFGIARAYSEAAGERVTESGIAVGTPGYMSPEQASGETRLDGRTDIYAVGCVLYEMLAGEPPYNGPTPQSIVAKQMSLPVPSLAVVRSTVPPALDRLLQRALAKAPADRIATAAEFDAGLEVLQHGLDAEVAAPIVRQRRRAWIAAAAVAAALAGVIVVRQPWRGDRTDPALGDTTRYVVLAPQRMDVAPNVLPDLHALVREALERWSGITVSDSAEARSARRVSAALSSAGDSLRLRVQLMESNGSLLADHTERLSRGDPAAARLTRVVDRLLFRDGAPPNDPIDGSGRSLPSRQAFVRGLQAIEAWQLPAAESLFQAAATYDASYARANLWLALARAWRDVEPARWRAAAQQALAGAQALTASEARMADIVVAQAVADFPRACAGWRSLTLADPNDALAWFGSAHCQRKDALVVPDPASPSRYRFRSSYHRALQDYRRAFQLRPAFLASLSYSELQALFRTAGTKRREGRSAAPDSQPFLADAEWQHDTLAYVPYPRNIAHPGVSPPRSAEAIRRLRLQMRDAASTWVIAAPRDPNARELLSLTLAELGDNSALDTIAVAQQLATDGRDRLRIAIAAAWLRLGAALALGRPDSARQIPRFVDSLLQANPPPSDQPLMLAALAALTGRGHAAAAYAMLPQLDREFGVPASLRASAAPLLLYSALGGPADSIVLLERRTDAAIDATLRPAARANERLAILARAATMAYPAYRLHAFSSLAGQGDGLLDLQVALDRGDSTFVLDSLQRIRRIRSQLAPEMITLDALAPEVQILVALRQHAAAARWVDPTITAFSQAIPRLRATPIEAASVVRVLAARATIAAELGQRSEAIKWASFVRILWDGADRYLLPLLHSLPAAP